MPSRHLLSLIALQLRQWLHGMRLSCSKYSSTDPSCCQGRQHCMCVSTCVQAFRMVVYCCCSPCWGCFWVQRLPLWRLAAQAFSSFLSVPPCTDIGASCLTWGAFRLEHGILVSPNTAGETALRCFFVLWQAVPAIRACVPGFQYTCCMLQTVLPATPDGTRRQHCAIN